MKKYLYYKEKDYTLYKGKMQDVLRTFEKESVDSIVCDPPYHLTSITERFGKKDSAEAKYGKDGSFQRLSRGFMGKEWDGGDTAFQPDTWKHCFDVLKPGGYLLAFGGSRTFHRIACAIEDAGFEIRDTIMWLYGSGFPKSYNIGKQIEAKVLFNDASGRSQKKLKGKKVKAKMWTHHWSYENGKEKKDYSVLSNEKVIDVEYTTDLGKQWQGWGTCLKPAYEPIIVARKPFKGSLVDNVIENGVGGINIDECRVGNTNADNYDLEKRQVSKATGSENDGHFLDKLHNQDAKHGVTNLGRFPANVILTYDETDFEEVCGGMPNDDLVSASRYFYCAKASKKDRDEGLDLFETKTKVFNGKSNESSEEMKDVEKRFTTQGKNIHPTVKPVELMQYLVRLVTPKCGTIMDCFMGSGSTGKAVMFENRERNANYHFIGVEMTEEYLPICQSRIDYALNKYEYDLAKEIQKEKDENEKMGYVSLFDF